MVEANSVEREADEIARRMCWNCIQAGVPFREIAVALHDAVLYVSLLQAHSNDSGFRRASISRSRCGASRRRFPHRPCEVRPERLGV